MKASSPYPWVAGILALAVAVLLVLAMVGNWFQAIVEGPVVTMLAPAPVTDLDTIAIQPAGGPSIVLRRTNDTWTMAEPFPGPANREAVENLTYALTNIPVIEQHAPGDPRRPKEDVTGLAAGAVKVVMHAGDHGRFVLRVGKQRPLARETYVLAEGDPSVYVVRGELRDLLATPAETYRSDRVFPFDPSRIEQIQLTGRSNWTIQSSDGRWRIVRPVRSAILQDRLEELLATIASLRIVRYPQPRPDALEPFGLHDPTATLTVTWREKPADDTSAETPATTRSATLQMAPSSGRIFARLDDQNWPFEIPTPDYESITLPLNQLRTDLVMPLEPASVTSVRVMTASGTWSARRDGEKWVLTEPYQGQADVDAIDLLLDWVGRLPAVGFADRYEVLSGFGLDPPSASLELGFEDGSRQALLLGDTLNAGAKIFVKRSDAPTVYTVPINLGTELTPSLVNVWGKTLFSMNPNRIIRIRVQREDGTYVLVRDAEGTMQLVSPPGETADEESITALLRSLARVRTGRITSVSEKAPASQADATTARITIEFLSDSTSESPSPATLIVAKAPTGAHAWVENQQPIVIGEVGDALGAAAWLELRDRTLWRVEPDLVSSITLETAKATLRWNRRGDQWVASQGPTADLNRVRGFLTAFSELRVVRFLEAPPDDLLSTGSLTLVAGEDDYILQFGVLPGREYVGKAASSDRWGVLTPLAADWLDTLSTEAERPVP